MGNTVSGWAVLSTDGAYRYELWRIWAPGGPLCAGVMLNPSTADAHHDDLTTRRCVRGGQSWGYGGLVIVNLYALRARDPAPLRHHPDPVGPRNDHHIPTTATQATSLVCAWGAHPLAARRAAAVITLLHHAAPHTLLHCRGTTHTAAPRHPLYTPRTPTPREGVA
jgi:hypothetical protein